jgi:5'-3' exonuclease
MCGTDYNPNIYKVGSVTAYKLIKEHGSIDEIGKNTKKDISVLNHTRVTQLFTEFEDYGIDTIPYCGKPDFEKLKKFVIERGIQINIDRLHSDFTQNIVVFEDSDREDAYVLRTSAPSSSPSD